MVMILVWTGVITLLTLHAQVIDGYLKGVAQLGLRGQPAATTPMKAAFPSFAVDAKIWVRHALSLTQGDQIRLRHTTIDNAPEGREVHWNSAWAWTIVAAGGVEHALTGKPMPEAIEAATRWLPTAVFITLILGLSFWVARRAGALAGGFIALAMAGHPRISEGFYPTYVDHHGLLTVAAMGLVLGAAFMGAGWWQPAQEGVSSLLPASPETAKRAAMFSGLAGACGMWVSAASSIPPIAIVGAAGLVTILGQKREGWGDGAAKFDPGVWRTWGRTGALASFCFYLLEYFPNHLGLRLEPNHPFYSLAWLGGGELIAQAGEGWFRLAPAASQPARLRLLGAVAAVLLAPVTILIGGVKVFGVMDPFMVGLHKNIQEFLPLWMSIKAAGWSRFFAIVGPENLGLVAGLVLLAVRGRRCPPVVWLTVAMAFGFIAMGWYQARWLLNASGAQVVAIWVVLAYLIQDRAAVVRWGVAAAAGALIFLPPAFKRLAEAEGSVRLKQVVPKDALEMLFRDVAAAIREASPEGDIVLLSSPNSSAGIGYFGQFGTVGTLYWENAVGLKKAAEIHSAQTLEEAAELLQRYKVTHVAFISDESFVAPYFQLFRGHEPGADLKKSLGYQILINRAFPVCLEIIPYAVPADLKGLNVNVYLFKVALDQTPAEALYHIALNKVALGLMSEAEKDFDVLIRELPDDPSAWLRKSELLVARGDWSGGTDALINGIRRVPAEERLALFNNAGMNLYQQQRVGEAIRVFRAALEERFTPEGASDLAFLLSTTRQDALRDGRLAEEIARRGLALRPDSVALLNALAVAQAENGRFDEAAATAERATTLARQQGDNASAAVSAQRLQLFRAGQPVRQ